MMPSWHFTWPRRKREACKRPPRRAGITLGTSLIRHQQERVGDETVPFGHRVRRNEYDDVISVPWGVTVHLSGITGLKLYLFVCLFFHLFIYVVTYLTPRLGVQPVPILFIHSFIHSCFHSRPWSAFSIFFSTCWKIAGSFIFTPKETHFYLTLLNILSSTIRMCRIAMTVNFKPHLCSPA